jgi:nitrate reductase NapD
MQIQESINISGILVRTLPKNLPDVQAQLDALSGVEIHAATSEGRLVVTVEKEDSSTMADAFVQIQNLNHVISASLVYQHNEPIDANEIDSSNAENNS